MCLTEDEEVLRVFKRMILRMIMGSVKGEDGELRRIMNHEIRETMGGEDIVRDIKPQS